MTEECSGNNHRHQSHCKNDQVITNLQHSTLEMADGMSVLHQFRSLAEVGVGTRGVHHRVGFAALDDRSRKDCLARFARRGQRFSGQRGLVDLHRVAG